MIKKFADFGDAQLDYPFLKKPEAITEQNAVEDGMGNQTDFNIPFIEEESAFVRELIDAYSFSNKDFYSEAMSWAANGLTPVDIKQHIQEDLNISISLAEAEQVMSELSKAVDNTAITASMRKYIPLKKACMDSMVKVASNGFKCKYADVYWQVKSVEWEGEERLCLVRVED